MIYHARGPRAGAQNGWSHSGKDPAAVAFDESLVSVEDIDFGRRLKVYGRRLGKRYGTIGRHGITTSCRKFDQFGDRYLFRNPQLV